MTFRRSLTRDYTLFTWTRDPGNAVILKEIYYENEWIGREGTYEKSVFDDAHYNRAFRLEAKDIEQVRLRDKPTNPISIEQP